MDDSASWPHRFAMWDAYFGLAAVATGAAVASSGSESVSTRGWAIALLVAMAAWYVGYGRPLMRYEIEDSRAYVYFAGVAVLFVMAVALVSASSYALLALCPQAFMVLSTLRAINVVVLLNVAIVVISYLSTRDLRDTVRGPLPAALLAIAGSAVFGTWAKQVSAQNYQRADLIKQLNGSRAQVAQLSHEAGALAERQRLAGDLHDTVAQGLSSVIMLIQAADAEVERDVSQARRHLELALATARDNLDDARALVGALTPAELDGSSLADALNRLVDRFTQQSDVRAAMRVEGEPVGLATAVEVVLLRAAQESLTNVRKHAGAETVTVRLSFADRSVAVEVVDDGCGFTTSQPCGGYGLSAMRARVEQVSGILSVQSAPGAGTTVRVEVPNN